MIKQIKQFFRNVWTWIKKIVHKFKKWLKIIFIGSVVLASTGATTDLMIVEQKSADLREAIVIEEGYYSLTSRDLETFGLSSESAQKLSICFDNQGKLDINDRHLMAEYAEVLNKAKKLTGVDNLGTIEKDKMAKKFNYLITEAAKIKRASILK